MTFVEEKTRELMAAPSCCAELKAAAQAWLDAAGTAKEQEETKKYIAELEADIMPVDGLIGFAESEAAHGREIKAAGAKYCDCPACAAAEAILAKKDQMLA